MALYSGGTPYTAPTGPQGVSTGYDIGAARLDGVRREQALERRNAVLHNGSQYIEFYCNGTDFNQALAGKTAQSKYVRDFYAHNIQIPPMTIQAQCLDQEDYATVVEFVHDAQRKAVGGTGLIQLQIDGKISGQNIGTGSDLVQANTKPEKVTLKGSHKPVLVQGYIPKMGRKHERFVYAPEFSFQFIVVESFAGLYTNVISELPAERTWLEIINSLVQESPKPEEIEAKAQEKAGEFAGELGNKLKKIFENGF